jgi:hypothetical protein
MDMIIHGEVEKVGKGVVIAYVKLVTQNFWKS